jgi:hypothetical protein
MERILKHKEVTNITAKSKSFAFWDRLITSYTLWKATALFLNKDASLLSSHIVCPLRVMSHKSDITSGDQWTDSDEVSNSNDM